MSNKKPVIGITLDLQNDSEKYSYARKPWYALRQNYSDCVRLAGGLPLLVPYDPSSIKEILDLIDGLIIPGGDEDIHPKFYGQDIKSSKVKTNNERADFEYQLLKQSLARDLPFLGICNGMQMLNILLGGDLIQDIPTFAPSNINHEQPHPKDIPSHLITIVKGTKLAELSNESEIMVNSTHHQAVGNLGNNLIVSAIAPDGIIEAIESTAHKFVIGVEWHPEHLSSNPLDLNLFKSLVYYASFK